MSDLQVLREWTPLSCNAKMIKESREKYGKVMLSGIIQRANTLNQNGRVYPKSILEREIMNYQKLIRENRALGECDHPDSSVVELKNVSHIVREAYMKGDDVYGRIEILDTPSGKIIQSLIESGVTLGISSRGVGSTVSQSGNQIVQDDFQLICFDMVSEPSTPGAFMLKENKTINRKELDKFFTQTDKIDRIFNDILRWWKMNNKTKNVIKSIVKECLMEILAEGLVSNQTASKSQTMQLKGSLHEASERMQYSQSDSRLSETNLNIASQSQRSQRTSSRSKSYLDSIEIGESDMFHNKNDMYNESINRTVGSITNDDLMSELLKDTAMTTLREQSETNRAMPPVSAGGDAAAKLADQSDPMELFGGVSSNWANLAFSGGSKR